MSRKAIILAWTVMFVGLGCHLAAGATVAFNPPVTYPVGTAPRGVAAADLNGDGKMDLAVTNFGDSNLNDKGGVSILLGNGDGTFQSAKTFNAGNMPESIAIGDFNRDGALDIIAVSETENVLNLLFGNGDGTFQPVFTVALDVDLYYVITGDLNNDHKIDVALLGLGRDLDGDGIRDSPGGIEVLLGNGDGSFQHGTLFGTNGANLAAADFNQDGNLDLATDNFGVDVYLGRGDGSFNAPIHNLPNPSYLRYLQMGDFNLDGKPDIAALLPTHLCSYPPKTCNGTVDLFLGNGDGTFSPSFSSSGLYQSLAIGDFDADRSPDLALVAKSNVVLRGDGKGNFAAGGTFSINVPKFLLAADLNGDKLPDLVSTFGQTNIIGVELNATVPDPDFSVAAAAAIPAIIGQGQSSTANITLNSLNAFTDSVALVCSVQPAQSGLICSLDSNSVNFDANGRATATLTMTAGSMLASMTSAQSLNYTGLFEFVWVPVLGFAFLRKRILGGCLKPRELVGFVSTAFLVCGLILQAACGGGGSNDRPLSHSYTVLVTGSSGSTQHSTSTTLMVK
jgi:FG-GAP-like repeat